MKAILVIDIPDDVSIEKCVIDYEITEKYHGEQLIADGVTMLRPLPRRNQGKFFHHDFGENTYVCGWNACLDEILGEENG